MKSNPFILGPPRLDNDIDLAMPERLAGPKGIPPALGNRRAPNLSSQETTAPRAANEELTGAAPGWGQTMCDLRAAWDRRRTHSFELPMVVWKVKRQLPRGQWSRLCKSECVPFSKRKGEMLARVGKWLDGLNAQTCAHLPEAWTTLHALSALAAAELLFHIDEQRIHPGMSLLEARTLTKNQATGPRQTLVLGRLARFGQFVAHTVRQWSGEEHAAGQRLLLDLLDLLQPPSISTKL